MDNCGINKTLTGKRVLLFSPLFYGYSTVVKEAFKHTGAIVDCFEFAYTFLNYRNKWDTTIRRCISKEYRYNFSKNTKYLSNIKHFCLGNSYDILFVIQIYPFDSNFILNLRDNNPSIKTYIYFWDSFEVYNLIHVAENFDVVCSFNWKDVQTIKAHLNNCEKNKLVKYLPNFYISDENTKKTNNGCYDIAFIGTVNIDTLERCQFIKQVDGWCRTNDIKSFLYLRYLPSLKFRLSVKNILRYCIDGRYRKYVNGLNKILSDDTVSFMNVKPLSLEQVSKIENSSNCILDIAHINRQGYTINSITAVAKGKKLITTNTYIKNEPFFNSNNICVVDVFNPLFDKTFFMKPVCSIDISCLEVNNWIFMILNDNYYRKEIKKVSSFHVV